MYIYVVHIDIKTSTYFNIFFNIFNVFTYSTYSTYFNQPCLKVRWGRERQGRDTHWFGSWIFFYKKSYYIIFFVVSLDLVFNFLQIQWNEKSGVLIRLTGLFLFQIYLHFCRDLIWFKILSKRQIFFKIYVYQIYMNLNFEEKGPWVTQTILIARLSAVVTGAPLI